MYFIIYKYNTECVKEHYIYIKIINMYKMISKGHQTIFKPRRMVIGGIVYNVENEETLNKIKQEMAAKKEADAKVAEEVKNQKILIKRTVSKNMNDIVTKIIVDPSTILTKEEKMHQENKNNKYAEHTKKPSLTVKSNIPPSNNENKNIITNDGPIKVKTHPHKLIKKPTERDNLLQNNAIQSNNFMDNNLNEQETRDDHTQNKNIEGSTILGGTVHAIVNNTGKQEQQVSVPIPPKKQMVLKSNERKMMTKTINKTPSKTFQIQEEEATDNYFTKKYPVLSDQWYELIIKIKQLVNNNAIKLLIKVFDENKTPIIHPTKISNDLFLHEKYPNNFVDYKIYLYMPKNSTAIDVYIVGLKVYNIILSPVDKQNVEQNVDLWKFRKLNDLEFINYYIKNADLEYSEKFIDRFRAEYNLFKNPYYFEQFVNSLTISKIPTKSFESNSKIKILYIVHTSIEYEQYSNTLRTQQLLENFNKNKNYKIICATRYGYPFDRENGYYTKDPVKETKYNDVKYVKFIKDKSSNFNTLNILKYLEQNIIDAINFCVNHNIKIIHATTNYWNGIVAISVAQYLGIKCIYEIRELWNENIMTQKPEVLHSDIVNMMATQEKNIINNVDKIIVLNNAQNKYDRSKTEILYDGANVHVQDKDKNKDKNNTIKNKLLNKYNLHNKIVIGYIGTLAAHEGIEYILKCIKLLNDDKIAFVIIGDGPYKNAMLEFIKTNNITDNVLYLGKIKYEDAMNYYQIFDMCIYPKIKCELSELKSSFKLIEAMSFKKPIITTNLKANCEIISDGENGLLCSPDDVNELLDKMKLLISDNNLRESLGNNAQNWIKKNRNWEDICNKLSDIYDGLMKEDENGNCNDNGNGNGNICFGPGCYEMNDGMNDEMNNDINNIINNDMNDSVSNSVNDSMNYDTDTE